MDLELRELQRPQNTRRNRTFSCKSLTMTQYRSSTEVQCRGRTCLSLPDWLVGPEKVDLSLLTPGDHYSIHENPWREESTLGLCKDRVLYFILLFEAEAHIYHAGLELWIP